jgi:hypothetical protein
MSEITRRDFISGTLVAVGSTVLPFQATSHAAMTAMDPSYYPPARTGLRGSHLTGMLPKKLFNFDRDVASISVNRWAHGYTIAGPGDSTKIGRQPFGRITVANTDSAASSDAKTAVMMAWRAVSELS